MDDASTSTSARIRNVLVTNMSLTPTGYLQNRLNKNLNHLPVPCTKPEPICQIHRWAIGRKYKSKIMFCKSCNVSLCDYCYEPFHVIPDLVEKKDVLKKLLIKKSSVCSIVSELLSK